MFNIIHNKAITGTKTSKDKLLSYNRKDSSFSSLHANRLRNAQHLPVVHTEAETVVAMAEMEEDTEHKEHLKLKRTAIGCPF